VNPITRGLLNLRNSLDWNLRNLFTWSPTAVEVAEDKEAETGASWTGRYTLGEARTRMTAWRWNRNLAFLETLDRVVQEPRVQRFLASRPTLKALDIGSKNFDYVDALAAVLSQAAGRRVLDLTGLEVDAHRRYTDFRTRRAWAEHYCSFVPGTRYLAQGLEDHQGAYGLISWFLPFLTERPLVRWGLPASLLRPGALYDHAYGLLEPGGVLVLVNLNGDEEGLQHGLIQQRGHIFTSLGSVPSTFIPERRDQRVTLVWKDRG
jgi:hypothetical protein